VCVKGFVFGTIGAQSVGIKRDALDIIFSKCVRLAANCCEAHGVKRHYGGEWVESCKGDLESCHIHSRSNKFIHVDPLNAISMCGAHHRWFTAHPLFWKDFCLELRGQEHMDILNEKLNYFGHKWLKGMKAEARKHYRNEFNLLVERRNNGETGKLTFVGYL